MAKNPYSNMSIFVAQKEKVSNLIIIGYTRSGNALAFNGYSDEVVGRACGYGYDKTTTALQQAVEKLFSVDFSTNGMAGFEVLKNSAKKEGIEIKSLSDLIYC